MPFVDVPAEPYAQARTWSDLVNQKCSAEVTLDDEHHAVMIRQAMSAWLRARGKDDSLVWNLTTQGAIATAHNGRNPIANTPESFAYEMYSRRGLAYNANCVPYESAWICFLDWYARPENAMWWLPPTGNIDGYMPDSAFKRCRAVAAQRVGPSVVIGQEAFERAVAQQQAAAQQRAAAEQAAAQAAAQQASAEQALVEQAAAEQAAADEVSATRVKWGVGVLVVGGLAVGVWYLARQPKAKPKPKKRPKPRAKP